jgi:hypothetical protein
MSTGYSPDYVGYDSDKEDLSISMVLCAYLSQKCQAARKLESTQT